MEVDFDVAIIGGGPAGCACALALHGKGLKVALFEKEVFPRDKICGDAIPGSTFKAMYSISRNWGDQMTAFAKTTEINSISIFLDKTTVFKYRWKLFSYNSKRMDFDTFNFQLVRNETDTIIFENKPLQKIITEPNYYECSFLDGSSIKAALVVGCDGANSVVKRQLIKSDPSDRNPIAAIRAYYKGIEGIQSGYNEVHFIKGVEGYFWIFPLRDGWANVGFGVTKKRKQKSDSPTNIRKILEGVTQSPAFAGRFKNATQQGQLVGFGLPIWTKQRRICGDRFLLCGDSASLVDPAQGHGIDTAMWSGVIAAEQIISCFKATDFSAHFMTGYEKKLYKKIGGELSRSYFLMRLFTRFPFLMNVIGGVSPPQGLIDWLFRKLKI